MEAEVEWNLNASFFPQHVVVFTFLFGRPDPREGRPAILKCFF